MLSNKRLSIAQQVGQSVAYDLFVMMLNPKYRGENFKWENLKNIAMSLADCQVGLAGVFGKDLLRMKEIARRSAGFTIDSCLKESDIQSWYILKKSDE